MLKLKNILRALGLKRKPEQQVIRGVAIDIPTSLMKKESLEELIEKLKLRDPAERKAAFEKICSEGFSAIGKIIERVKDDSEDARIRKDLLMAVEKIASRCGLTSLLPQINSIRKEIIKKYIDELREKDTKSAFDALFIFRDHSVEEIAELGADKGARLRVRKSALNLLKRVSEERLDVKPIYTLVRNELWKDLINALREKDKRDTAFNLLFSFGKEIIDFLIHTVKNAKDKPTKVITTNIIHHIVEETDISFSTLLEDKVIGNQLAMVILEKNRNGCLNDLTFEKLKEPTAYRKFVQLLRSIIENRYARIELRIGAIAFLGKLWEKFNDNEILFYLEKLAENTGYDGKIREQAATSVKAMIPEVITSQV